MATNLSEPTGGTAVINDPNKQQAPQSIVDQWNAIGERIKTEGITSGKTGEVLVAPTTLSNANKIDDVNKNINKLNEYDANRGITTDNNGVAKYADGSIVSTNPYEQYQTYLDNGGQMNMNVWENNERPSYDTDMIKTADTTKEDKEIQDLMDAMKASTDASTKALIDSIQKKYEIRKQDQTEINRRQQEGVKNALLMGGVTGTGSASQYAPVSSAGIISAQESYGIKQLADLDAEEQELIAQAKAAQSEEDYKMMELKMSMAEEKRKEKIEATTKLNETIAEQNAKVREENLQIQKENAIADIISPPDGSEGTTDPFEILRKIQNSGDKITTLDDINNVLKYVAESNGMTIDDFTGDVKNFQALKAIGELPQYIKDLPEGQQLQAYLTMIKGKTTSNTSPDGQSPTEAIDVNYERIIRGIGSIDTLTPTQRTAVENRVYTDGFYDANPPDWFVNQVEEEAKKSFTKEKLKQLWDEYRNPILERVSGTSSNREL